MNMRKVIILLLSMVALGVNAKTLVAYYSYTNNIERIVSQLSMQIDCDIIEIEPVEKGLDYAANNYAIGSAQIAAIRNNPGEASSYPAIDPVNVDLSIYDTVIIATPLWWSQMAAPMQTFLFLNGAEIAGKNIGLIVSSASSGINGVVADAKRLVPDGKFIEPALWIRSSQTSDSRSMLEQWLKDIDYSELTTSISVNLIDNPSAADKLVYNISGVFIGTDITLLPSGLYIIKQGDKTVKVLR